MTNPMRIAEALRTTAEFLSRLAPEVRAEFERAAAVTGVTLPQLVDQRCAGAQEAERVLGGPVASSYCEIEDARGAAGCGEVCELRAGKLSVIKGGKP